MHTAIELEFGADPIKITHVTDGTAQVGHGSYKSYALTDLVPFNGGTVTVQSALVELKGRNYLTEAIGILKVSSALVAAPLSRLPTISWTKSRSVYEACFKRARAKSCSGTIGRSRLRAEGAEPFSGGLLCGNPGVRPGLQSGPIFQ